MSTKYLKSICNKYFAIFTIHIIVYICSNIDINVKLINTVNISVISQLIISGIFKVNIKHTSDAR
jgi:hypothetical protein